MPNWPDPLKRSTKLWLQFNWNGANIPDQLVPRNPESKWWLRAGGSASGKIMIRWRLDHFGNSFQCEEWRWNGLRCRCFADPERMSECIHPMIRRDWDLCLEDRCRRFLSINSTAGSRKYAPRASFIDCYHLLSKSSWRLHSSVESQRISEGGRWWESLPNFEGFCDNRNARVNYWSRFLLKRKTSSFKWTTRLDLTANLNVWRGRVRTYKKGNRSGRKRERKEK